MLINKTLIIYFAYIWFYKFKIGGITFYFIDIIDKIIYIDPDADNQWPILPLNQHKYGCLLFKF